MMLHTALLLLVAVGGSLHCLGMCGSLIMGVNALACGTSRRYGLLGHAIYHGGRLTSYMFLGAIAGTFGHILASPAPFVHTLIDLGAGLLVLIIGLRLAGLLPVLNLVPLQVSASFVRPLASLLKVKRFSTVLSLGLFNGFIPCPLITAFLAQAASTGSPFGGALTMAILVFGTAPGMILFGYVVLSHDTRGKAVQASGTLLAILGTITLLHAVGVVPSPFGEH